MKVLLIWPNNPNTVLSNDLSCCEPLSLEYIAGTIAPHYEVEIWDLRLDPSLSTLALTYKPDVIGLAIPFTTMLPYALEVAQEVRGLWPNASLVLGGHHPTVSSMWIDRFNADYIITNEGGNKMLELVRSIESKEMPSRTKKTVVIKEDKITSFDTLMKPNREILKRHHQNYFHSIYNPVALIRFSAGCPYNCSFCILWKLTERQYITKNTDRIIEEINEIYSRNLYVVDDEAFIQPKRMNELANALEQAKVDRRYHMYLRADTAINNKQVLERWAKLGLDSVLIGAESFSDEELAGYGKKATSKDTIQALDFFRKNDVKVRANFIVRPDFSADDFKRLEETVVRLKIDLPSFAVLTPLPGTNLYNNSLEQITSENPEQFDCYHSILPTKLPLDKFYEHFADLMKNTSKKISLLADAPMFYYSNDGSFTKMVDKIRMGDQLFKQV